MFRTLNYVVGILVAVAAINGCSGNDSTSEDAQTSALADTGDIQEGTPEALAVLKLVNVASSEELDEDADLPSNAALNIVSYRAGDDQQSGTADDEVFDTLAELDAVPFVGPSAFSHLLAYAQSQGMVCKTCGADSCGLTDDGCGGILYCGDCPQGAGAGADCNFDRMFGITGNLAYGVPSCGTTQ